MSTATAPHAQALHPTVRRPNSVAVGTIVWLSSELMFFAGLFAMFFTLKSVVPEQFTEGQGILNLPFALANTVILVLSSVTCQIGVNYVERGNQFKPLRTGSVWNIKQWGMVEWFVLTFIMGSIFIAGQVFEYATLVHEGVTLNSNAFGSVFYLSTGFHGLHVTGGLIAFLLIIGRAFAVKRFGHAEAISAVVVSYYWHFVDIVWIALFAVVYLVP